MSKTRLALAALIAGLVTLFSTSAAFAYDPPVLNVTGGSAADGVVSPGEEASLSGDFGGTDCSTWVAAFEGGQSTIADGSGTTFDFDFTAPEDEGDYTINIFCEYLDNEDQPATAVLSYDFEVAAAGADAGDDSDDDSAGAGSGAGDASSALPDTGGSSLLLLVGGAALVLAGAGVLVARRRTA